MMNKKVFWVCVALGALIIVGVTMGRASPQPIEQATPFVTIKNTKIFVEIADTDAARVRGLSGRDALAEDHGLLFVFQEETQADFWMKDMKFPIDIIWIDAQKKIIHIEHSLSPATYPKTFSPEALSLYVLEVPAGFAKSHDILVGDSLTF